MSSAAFTCITCRVAFANADLQRSHYKTDWHRYNLKRKVADLPFVTAEGFNQRVLAQRAQAATAEQSKSHSFYCEPCGKKISSEAAFENHISSTKHSARIAKLEQQGTTETTKKSAEVKPPKAAGEQKPGDDAPMETTGEGSDEAWEEWDEDVLSVEECLFCSKMGKSLESNVKHMTTSHSFFIPDVEYLINLEGFITYLGEKIGSGKMCLWCSDKSKVFRSVKATQQHMVDKGHCMVLYDGDAVYEYADFYDYTKSYPDGEDDDPQMEVETSIINADDDEYTMTLPSGAKIGHRALARYYKQNLVSRVNPESRSILNKVMSHYKALGWTGATGVAVERRIKDLQYMQRTKHKHWAKLGIKANKTAQTHFRNQVMF